MAPKTCLIITISLVLSLLYMAGPANAGAARLAKTAMDILFDVVGQVAESYNEWSEKEKINIRPATEAYCARKFNQSIETLEDTLNKTADTVKNLTSFIDDWVYEAENNRINCVISNRLNNAAISNIQFSLVPYALCCLLYFAFVLLVSPVIPLV